MIEFRALGEFQVSLERTPISLGSPRQRTLLAVLLASANEALPAASLIDELWPDGAPRNALPNLRTYAYQLRRQLPAQVAARLTTRNGGYQLYVRRGEFDVWRLRQQYASARAALERGDPAAAVAALEPVRAASTGGAYAGVAAGPILAAVRAGVDDESLHAQDAYFEASIMAGKHLDVVGPLRSHVRRHPLSEHGHALLMEALCRAGDNAGALAAYRWARQLLIDELAVEPGNELQRLHQEILRGRSGSDRLPRAASSGRSDRSHPDQLAAPAELPPDISRFTGRDQVRDFLSADEHSRSPVVLSGPAGVGKTTLAVHWAHRMKGRFPDGQLFLDLRGFDADDAAMTVDEAARCLLEALHVTPADMPTTREARVGRYRSLLSDRRVLVVLDNARDDEQVRSLLPGGSGCQVVVTSRRHLGGLVATHAARVIHVDPMPEAEARALLISRLGEDRVAGEPGAALDIIRACSGYPLALVVVAARASVDPGLTLHALAVSLGRQHLEALAGSDRATDLRTVISSSYRALTAGAQDLLRRLGAHPGLSFAAAAAASAAGRPPGESDRFLRELADANLLQRYGLSRHGFHDLLGAYARELADADEAHHHVQRRILDHYLHTAAAAAAHLDPGREVPATPAIASGVTVPPHLDATEALAWFTVERINLMAATHLAAKAGYHVHAWQLAFALSDFLQRRGRWLEQVEVNRIAIAASEMAGDLLGQAHSHRGLGRACLRLHAEVDGEYHLQVALRLFERLGERVVQARTHLNIAVLREQLGRTHEAADHAQRALALFRSAGHEIGEAVSLNSVAWYRACAGDHRGALEACRQALPLLQRTGARVGEASAWDTLGFAHRHLADYPEAIACYRRALDLYQELGDRYYEAQVLINLGEAHRGASRGAAARSAWEDALAILEEIEHAEAAQVQAKLVEFIGS